MTRESQAATRRRRVLCMGEERSSRQRLVVSETPRGGLGSPEPLRSIVENCQVLRGDFLVEGD